MPHKRQFRDNRGSLATIFPNPTVVCSPTTSTPACEEKWWWNRRFANILIVSVGFMLVSTSFFTVSAVSNSVVHDMQKYGFRDGDGYFSLAIFFAAQLAVTPFIPLMVKPLGAKGSLLVGGLTVLLYVVTFEFTSRLLLLIVSAIYGIGMNLIWAGLGVSLTANSDVTNSNKYIGIFWTILNFCQIWGNIVVAVKFRRLDAIDDDTRRVTFGALIALVATGCITFLFIKERPDEKKATSTQSRSADNLCQRTTNGNGQQTLWQRFWINIRITVKLLVSPPILLSIGYFVFPAMSIVLYTTVIPTAIGFDKHFGVVRKQLIGIAGFVTGVAEILSSILLTFVIRDRIGRTYICIFGTIMIATATGFSVLNMPLHSATADSDDPTIMFGKTGSSVTICLICAVLFGIGDACINISIIALQSDVFGHEHDAKDVSDTQNVESLAGIKQMQSDATLHITMDDLGTPAERHNANSIRNRSAVWEPVTYGGLHISNEIDGQSAANSDLFENNDVEPNPVRESDVNKHDLDKSSTVASFAVANGAQSLLATVIFFLSEKLWLDTYFYITVPICIWTCVTFFLVERNYRAGKYKNYFRDLQK